MGNKLKCCNQIAQQPYGGNDPLLKPGDFIKNINQSQQIQMYRERISNIIKQVRKYSNTKSKKGITQKGIQQFLIFGKKQVNKQVQQNARLALCLNPMSITSLLNWSIELNPLNSATINDQFQQVKDYGFLKAFIYIYTGDLIYQQLRKQFTIRQSQKCHQLLKALMEQIKRIKQTNPEQFSQINFGEDGKRLKLRQQYIQVYRGISQFDKKIRSGNQLYAWRSFVSTSLKKQVAQQFANSKKGGPKRGSSFYNIKLDGQHPHDHIIVPSTWSKYEKQEQVLIFPFFQFICSQKIDSPTKKIFNLEQYNKNKHKFVQESQKLPQIKKKQNNN